jgi:hypothetical protein
MIGKKISIFIYALSALLATVAHFNVATMRPLANTIVTGGGSHSYRLSDEELAAAQPKNDATRQHLWQEPASLVFLLGLAVVLTGLWKNCQMLMELR